MEPHPESTESRRTVWQMMSALASDAYELRMVAPGEFELIEVDHSEAPAPEALANSTASIERATSDV